MPTTDVPRLMLVTDRHRSKRPLADLVQRAVAGGVETVQLRERDLERDERRRLASAIIQRLGGPARLVINGDIELAAELGCGVHLPEQGGMVADARARLGPAAKIGRSIHTPAGAASSLGADYVIAGHVFPTAGKPGQPPLGLAGLAAIVSAASVPVLAIGGITADRVGPVLQAGADGIAVIGAIAEADDPEFAAAGLRRQLDAYREAHYPMTKVESPAQLVTVIVNGKPATLPASTSIGTLLQQRALHDRLVAVELNGAIVSPSGFVSTWLRDGDTLEIVQFVGGG